VLFTGEYEHAIDAKQRLAIPSDLRSRLDPEIHGSAFYVAPGQRGSLWVWPEKTFEHMAAATELSLVPDEDLLEYEQLLYSQAARVDLDKTGRIRIPDRMIRMAGLQSNVVVLGVKDHLEVHDPKAWAALREEKFASQAEIMLRARRAIRRGGQGEAGQ
jgi:MraZ protein|tara:strand:+ start:233 stop:709 length:477 start_codon:yes stop_codon:yes gene_type:complete